jgi:uncharacterized protein YcbX
MRGQVRNLYNYPIKGLSAQALDRVTLVPGQGFPLDRAFGFARPGSGFDPHNPKPLPKTRFVVLARDAALAALETCFDPATQTLCVARGGQGGQAATFDIATDAGRVAAAAYLSDYLGYPPDMRPTLYSAAPHKFTDVSVRSPQMMNAVSLINADSVAQFADAVGAEVSPARFRANIVFSGIPPMAELDWVGREITIGAARLRVLLRTKRCAATEVNLATATRDLDVPRLLHAQFGHSDMGIYAEVVAGGEIGPEDALVLC